MPADVPDVPLEELVARVGAAVDRHRRRLAAGHGLTPTALAVLAALDDATVDGEVLPAPSHRDLAGRVALTPATLTPVLDALEAAGEVVRRRDAADRRIVRLHRTPAGRARLAAATPVRGLPRPAPDVEPAVRAYLLAVLAAAEAEG